MKRWLSAILLMSSLVVAGCASTPSAETPTKPATNASSVFEADADSSGADDSSDLVEVPDVVGESADDAQGEIEDARLTPSFDPEPDDSSLCDVSDQDETGEVEQGTEVILTLECRVDVPNTTGETADEAESDIETAGPDLTVSLDPEPDDPTACTVDDQDVVGEAEADSDVTLTLSCDSYDDGSTYDDGSGSIYDDGSGSTYDDGSGSTYDDGSSDDFCSTHDCIENFDQGTGSIVQCSDGSYSHSGGRPGACSYHGGEGP